jgi:hypothetical protein
MELLEGDEYEVGKDSSNLLNKKNCRLTAEHTSDRRKEELSANGRTYE